MTEDEWAKLLKDTNAAAESYKRIFPTGKKMFDLLEKEGLSKEESFCAALGLAQAVLQATGGTSFMMRASLISFFNAVDRVEELACLIPEETTQH